MEQKKWSVSGKDILGYILLGISVIMLGRSLMLCFSNDIWYDELFTVGMIEHSYGELVGFTARDVHPPFYYMITKLVVDLWKMLSAGAGTVVIAKVVSVLPYFLLLVYSVTFIRRRFSIFAGGLFLFCSIAMPQLSGYTVEVRMYSWALLFVTAAFLHAYGTVHAGPCVNASEDRPAGRRYVRVQKLHAAALVCYGLAAAYTQYFACVAVVMVYLYVLLVLIRRDRGRIREWIIWVIVSIAGYAPWLLSLYRQITTVRAGYWILPLSWRTFGGCIKFLMKPAFSNDGLNTGLAVVFFIIYVSVFIYEGRKLYYYRREKHINSNRTMFFGGNAERFGFMTAGVSVLAGVVLFGFAASMLIRPVFVYRYMIPAMGCFWLAFAAGVDDIGTFFSGRISGGDDIGRRREEEVTRTGRGKRVIRTIPACFILIFTAAVGLRDYRAFMGEEEYKIRLMKETEEALSVIGPEDTIIYNFDQVQAVTSYYLPEETDSRLWRGTPEELVQDIIRPYGSVEETQQIRALCGQGGNVWFIGSFNSRDDIVEEWAAEGVKAEETGSYLLERYWFNLYKISLERP